MKKIIFVLFLALLASCKPTQLIVHDIQYKDRFIHDSINTVQHDSIRITQNGDTIFYQTFKTIYKDRITIKHDSIFKSVDKPVMVDKIVTKEVEKKLTWSQRALIWMGKVWLFMFIGSLIYLFIKYLPSIRKIIAKML